MRTALLLLALVGLACGAQIGTVTVGSGEIFNPENMTITGGDNQGDCVTDTSEEQWGSAVCLARCA